MNNYDYFEFSKAHPEEILDEYYKKDLVVIPATAQQTNKLTENHARLVELISTFHTLTGRYQKDLSDSTVQNVVGDVIEILDHTGHINYSPFSQFFMVYNATYGLYRSLPQERKTFFIYEMLTKYCAERHEMYLSHGYTSTVLQVMCDNYSHKRNSKTGIDKALKMLEPYLSRRFDIQTMSLDEDDDFYFLPDKGDKRLFEQFLAVYHLKMESRKIEQNKLPDIVFKHAGQFYICELKTMKGAGGGQNKQIVEVAYFIRFSEKEERFHYLAFLDAEYSNILFHADDPKTAAQREDIIRALEQNPSNYFLNTAGFAAFLKEIFQS